jgi:hypothetical protein
MRFASMALLGSALAAGVLAAACGSNNGSSPNPGNDAGQVEDSSVGQDTGTAADSGTVADSKVEPEAQAEAGYPAFKPTDVPQVADAGGPVMATPKVVPIFYAADDSTTVASVEDFVTKLHGSAYWSSFATEYGVGDITMLAPVTLTATLPSTYDDSQIQADLAQRLNSGDPALPTPDANTIYAFFFPPNVTITTGGGAPPGDGGTADAGDGGFGGGVQSSCGNGFGGYHDNITLTNSMDVSYAVIPRCATYGGLSGLDAITGPASHEIAEAVTDPFPSTNPAYSTVDTLHFYWSRIIGGGEVGDMCEDNQGSFVKFPPQLPYTVQRIWSNKAALAGTDPCVPEPAGMTYYNTLPVMPDILTVTSRGGTINPKGVEIPVGASKTIELDLFSMAPTSGKWTVRLIDSSSTGSTYLSPTFQECPGMSTCTGQNGDKLHVTIKVLAAARRNYEPFFIESKMSAGVYNLWAGIVGSSPDGG